MVMLTGEQVTLGIGLVLLASPVKRKFRFNLYYNYTKTYSALIFLYLYTEDLGM